ncbi:hypothetical protein O9929_10615 [Vibrio lentus]|nr:hypothetical protein [Vibrio lentus]
MTTIIVGPDGRHFHGGLQGDPGVETANPELVGYKNSHTCQSANLNSDHRNSKRQLMIPLQCQPAVVMDGQRQMTALMP